MNTPNQCKGRPHNQQHARIGNQYPSPGLEFQHVFIDEVSNAPCEGLRDRQAILYNERDGMPGKWISSNNR